MKYQGRIYDPFTKQWMSMYQAKVGYLFVPEKEGYDPMSNHTSEVSNE